MSETKHTPGPLTIHGPSPGGKPDDDGGDYAIIDGDEYVIGEAIHVVDYAQRRPAKANAQLWAAAGDLLTACVLDNGFSTDGATLLEQAAYELRQHGPHLQALADELERKAKLERAAIAKARGEVT